MVRQTKKQKKEDLKNIIKESEEIKKDEKQKEDKLESMDLDTFSLGDENDNKYKWFDNRDKENSIESIKIRINKLENILKSVSLILSELS